MALRQWGFNLTVSSSGKNLRVDLGLMQKNKHLTATGCFLAVQQGVITNRGSNYKINIKKVYSTNCFSCCDDFENPARSQQVMLHR